MATDDVRIASWDMRASAGTTVSRPFTSDTAITSLSVWVGGTVDDVDDLTDATEYAATVDADGLGGTMTVTVPTGGSSPLRLEVDGAVVAVGRLIPSTTGTSSTDTITLATSAATFSLSIPSAVVSGGGTLDGGVF